MRDKRGSEIISLYWFAILFIVAGAVVYMAFIFYGAPYNVRNVESEILTNKIADCLSRGGYLKEGVLAEDFKNNFLENCDLNFNVEDVYGWETSGEATSGGGAEFGGREFGGAGASRSFGESGQYSQYYIEVNFYEFDQDSSDGTGEKISEIVAGNVNLKDLYLLEEAKKIESKKDLIIIHATKSAGLENALEEFRDNDNKSIHYIVNRDGFIVTKGNAGKIIEGGEKGVMHDDETAYHVAQYSVNKRSIGIENVNLLELCGKTTGNCKWDGGTCKSICEDTGNWIKINGTVWEKFPEEQIGSLASLVADIAARHDIPIDREHIKGHYEVDLYKERQDDPGDAFPWDEFMGKVRAAEKLGPGIGRSFYVVDKNNNQYIIKILAVIGKAEKNVA